MIVMIAGHDDANDYDACRTCNSSHWIATLWQRRGWGAGLVFLDALASLDFKLSVSNLPFSASASTGLSELFSRGWGAVVRKI